MVIQVIGLPGSGKSTAIRQAIEALDSPVFWFDLARLSGSNREARFADLIKQVKWNAIAESACGVPFVPSHTVQLQQSFSRSAEICRIRGEPVDVKYLQRLERQMIVHDMLFTDQEQLKNFLIETLGGTGGTRRTS